MHLFYNKHVHVRVDKLKKKRDGTPDKAATPAAGSAADRKSVV